MLGLHLLGRFDFNGNLGVFYDSIHFLLVVCTPVGNDIQLEVGLLYIKPPKFFTVLQIFI